MCFESDNDFKLDAMAKFLQSMMHNSLFRLKTGQKGGQRKVCSRNCGKGRKKKKDDSQQADEGPADEDIESQNENQKT